MKPPDRTIDLGGVVGTAPVVATCAPESAARLAALFIEEFQREANDDTHRDARKAISVTCHGFRNRLYMRTLY
jgi:hypothetical protein